LRVIAPLGILLPRGLGLKIDDREIGSTGFVRCLESGCVAEVDMDNSLIDTFKKGKTALFAIFLTPEEGRGLPVTLAGFEQGFAQLQ
jgi:invasion protein IalB